MNRKQERDMLVNFSELTLKSCLSEQDIANIEGLAYRLGKHLSEASNDKYGIASRSALSRRGVGSPISRAERRRWSRGVARLNLAREIFHVGPFGRRDPAQLVTDLIRAYEKRRPFTSVNRYALSNSRYLVQLHRHDSHLVTRWGVAKAKCYYV